MLKVLIAAALSVAAATSLLAVTPAAARGRTIHHERYVGFERDLAYGPFGYLDPYDWRARCGTTIWDSPRQRRWHYRHCWAGTGW
jgi:hypothetical protein